MASAFDAVTMRSLAVAVVTMTRLAMVVVVLALRVGYVLVEQRRTAGADTDMLHAGSGVTSQEDRPTPRRCLGSESGYDYSVAQPAGSERCSVVVHVLRVIN